MRLYLLPISTRRTLIYAKKLNVTISEQQSLIDKATTRAANLWASWEKKDKGWQKKIVDWGNTALKRIPYEEWGLKSIPPLSTRKKPEEVAGKEVVEVTFPPAIIPESKVLSVLGKLGTERESFHRSRIMYCVIGTPITAPIALIPVVPNLPFFYLIYRAWSHWRALSGSKHIQFLLQNNFAKPVSSPVLDTIYSAGIIKAVREDALLKTALSPVAAESIKPAGYEQSPETLLLNEWSVPLITKALDIPELQMELDRAVWQVENAMKKGQELKEEKDELEKGQPQTVETTEPRK